MLAGSNTLYVCEREEFIFNTFIYFSPVKRLKNRDNVRTTWRFDNSASKRVLDLLQPV